MGALISDPKAQFDSEKGSSKFAAPHAYNPAIYFRLSGPNWTRWAQQSDMINRLAVPVVELMDIRMNRIESTNKPCDSELHPTWVSLSPVADVSSDEGIMLMEGLIIIDNCPDWWLSLAFQLSGKSSSWIMIYCSRLRFSFSQPSTDYLSYRVWNVPSFVFTRDRLMTISP